MGILDKLDRARAIRAIPTQTLQPRDIERVRFYQIKSETVSFFREIGVHGVPTVADTPHYKFAYSILKKGRQNASAEEELYRNYLRASWVGRNWDIEEKISKFRKHFEMFLFSRSNDGPIITTFLGEDDLYAADGNHRLAFSLAANRSLDVKIAPFHDALKIFAPLKAHVGPGKNGKPCQSLFFNERMIATGQRIDLIERLNLIPKKAIKDKSILDVASSFGMSSLIAKGRGAKSCAGIERARELVDFANKMSILHEREDTVSFSQHDFGNPEKKISGIYDTAFAFSMNNELTKIFNLVDIFKNNVKKHVIFECPPKESMKDFPEINNSGIFRKCRFLGNLSYSYNRPEKCRKLYMLTK